jgi:hypothetical protein
MDQLKYVGMDVHKATIVIVILNALGHFQKQVIIKTKAEAIREFIRIAKEYSIHSAYLDVLGWR